LVTNSMAVLSYSYARMNSRSKANPPDDFDPKLPQSLFKPGGAVFGSKQTYQIVTKIGSGPFGPLWKAVVPATGFEVAIRQPPEASECLQREIANLLLLSEFNVPRVPKLVEAISQQDQPPLIVTEMINARPLPRQMLSEREARNFLYQCSETLHMIHSSGIIHRNLQPANFFLHEDTSEPWIVGFELSTNLKLTLKAQNTRFEGVFNAPEIQHGVVGTYSDIYSLGITLLHLTGPPFRELAIDEILERNFTYDFSAILIKMTNQDFHERYHDCSQIMKDLLDLIPIQQPPQPPKPGHEFPPIYPGAHIQGLSQTYSVTAELARGGFGVVWKATLIQNPKIQVAVKQPLNLDGRDLLDREAGILKQLVGIPRVQHLIETIAPPVR